MARKSTYLANVLKNAASRVKTNAIATVRFIDDGVSFCDGPGMLIRKTTNPCFNST